MSKTRTVEVYQQNGINYSQISSPLDLIKAQNFAHEHREKITTDFLIKDEVETAGCALTLNEFLSATVGDGGIYRAGLQFDAEETVFIFDAADGELARIDSIIVVLSENAPTNDEFLAFQRIRTADELADNATYPPMQFQRATERHNIAALTILKGAPAEDPQPPALSANEVEIYRVTIPAEAMALISSMISDERRIVANLRTLKSELTSLTEQLVEVNKKLDVLKYRNPTILASNGKLPYALVNDGGTYKIEVPLY